MAKFMHHFQNALDRQTTTRPTSKIMLDVGGTKFRIMHSSVHTHPDTLLGSLTEAHPSYEEDTKEYYFDRNPLVFTYILDYYRTGELHFPSFLCGPTIKKELVFWGIDENHISGCCWRHYKEVDDEQEHFEELDKVFKEESSYTTEQSFTSVTTEVRESKWPRMKLDIWNFLENPNSSTTAKAWAIFFFALIVVSITIVCVETVSFFRIPKARNVSVNSTMSQLENNETYISNPKIYLLDNTEVHPVLLVTEQFSNIIFTVEIIIRFIVCPAKLKMVTSVMTWIDLLSIISVWIMLILKYATNISFSSVYPILVSLISLRIVRMLRIFRLFKIANRHIGIKILLMALKASSKELTLLATFVLMGMLIFSTLIYYAEFETKDTYQNIPIGFWWSIVTMTTVGYGDIYPKTILGYIVGSACALSGMLLTGLPIPIIANNFQSLYSYAKTRQRLVEKERLAIRIKQRDEKESNRKKLKNKLKNIRQLVVSPKEKVHPILEDVTDIPGAIS